MIISLGNSTIHIVPIIHGQIQYLDVKRINVGGANSFEIFQKNMNLKFFNQKNRFTLKSMQVFLIYFNQNFFSKKQTMYEKFNYVSTNYQDQLNYFKYGLKAFENTKYNNAIKYKNNILIMKEQLPNLVSPLILDVSTANTETVLVKIVYGVK